MGVGGVNAINLSHFIGDMNGMENMMGKADNPLRYILNYASKHFLHGKLPLWHILIKFVGRKRHAKIRT